MRRIINWIKQYLHKVDIIWVIIIAIGISLFYFAKQEKDTIDKNSVNTDIVPNIRKIITKLRKEKIAEKSKSKP